MFRLHENLSKKDFIIDLKLCRVLLEDNQFYPWIFLIPRKNNVTNMLALTMEERLQLMRETALCEKVMADLFSPDQINVAAIGNMTPQLHLHIVCRNKNDPDWPDTVWNKKKKTYDPEQKLALIDLIRSAIEQASSDVIYEQ